MVNTPLFERFYTSQVVIRFSSINSTVSSCFSSTVLHLENTGVVFGTLLFSRNLCLFFRILRWGPPITVRTPGFVGIFVGYFFSGKRFHSPKKGKRFDQIWLWSGWVSSKKDPFTYHNSTPFCQFLGFTLMTYQPLYLTAIEYIYIVYTIYICYIYIYQTYPFSFLCNDLPFLTVKSSYRLVYIVKGYADVFFYQGKRTAHRPRWSSVASTPSMPVAQKPSHESQKSQRKRRKRSGSAEILELCSEVSN